MDLTNFTSISHMSNPANPIGIAIRSGIYGESSNTKNSIYNRYGHKCPVHIQKNNQMYEYIPYDEYNDYEYFNDCNYCKSNILMLIILIISIFLLCIIFLKRK